MRRGNRMVWYAVRTNKELLVLEEKKIGVPPYSLERDEAVDLQAALGDCLGLLDSQPPIPPLTPETPCSSAPQS